MEGFKGIFMETLPIHPGQKVDDWQHNDHHQQSPKNTLPADNLERRY